MGSNSLNPEAYLKAQYAREMDRIISDLTTLTERMKNAREPGTDAIASAMRVLSNVHNALPNLSLGMLMQRAHDIEVFKTQLAATARTTGKEY